MEEENDNKRLEYCPVCGQYKFQDPLHVHEICDVCGWEDSEYLDNFPDYAGGANVMSLNEARKAWKEGKKVY